MDVELIKNHLESADAEIQSAMREVGNTPAMESVIDALSYLADAIRLILPEEK